MMLIPSLKSKTKHLGIRRLSSPKTLYLPLQGYNGVMELCVKEGDTVKKYQHLAALNGSLASCIHAPVSGIVEGIVYIQDKPYLQLQNDFKDTEVSRLHRIPDALSKADIISLMHDYGIIGSGGAKFPTQVKYEGATSKLSYFIINGVECEPYLSADYALMKEQSEALLSLLALLQKVLQIKRIVFGIEKQHKELKKLLLTKAQQLSLDIDVKILENTYPQGGELQLIKAVTGKELPKGSIPVDHDILVNNVGTLWAMYNALYNNIPYTERVITVSGEKGKELGNFNVKIGTPVAHIIEELGVEHGFNAITTILGGPMMGKALNDTKSPINKGSGGILFIENPTNDRYNCIQCGYCTDVCPQHLMPMEFARYETQGNSAKLEAFNLNDCIECGACAYICPSDVPLMKSIFSGKQLLRTV
ncbi:electron transport complex subunit RsxC [Mangrovimonas cancribranchiae]|uniref:Ion-translocating oxidoreductase complex subunit C n=1 Tax=Mangrovimonas cancribranchiae TaxID=3080055 RepID=A0AAU6P4C4_9FLAO